ncbi:MAG: ABC transporter permease [Phycisphaerae bacterium]|nr:ABC transporter permease [Phycisphaerae bacterium]
MIRRLLQAAFTLFGVMLLTFLLFNQIAGDIASQYLGPKATEQQKQAFREKHDLDMPKLYNDAPELAWWQRVTRTLFVRHLVDSVTFRSESFVSGDTLLEIIAKKARYSLAITVPALALGFISAMIVSCLVAYYRGTWIDNAGVFLSVLGMCIPVLAYMIIGQYVVFAVAPGWAYGLMNRENIYVPVIIATIAGLGGAVRFYRTVILNEINQDYVRTARAKGVPLPTVLFRHVLKNCMLPILTNLVLSIPFLILGSLLLERFFGVPGLGELMVSSISQRDVPIINGLTFLTALIYTLGLLLTDVLYAVFDPRIRLQ